MTHLSGFFADGTEYGQGEFAQALYTLTGDGVNTLVGTSDTCLQVGASSPGAMSVTIQPGKAWIRGYWYWAWTAETLAIAAADASNPRIDRVVVRLDAVTAKAVDLAVITGTPAASPVAPALTTGAGGICEIALADVMVPAHATAIQAANVTDRRFDDTLCGIAQPHQVTTGRIEGIGNLAMGGNKVTGLGTPTASGDAATKGYVDGIAFGGAVPTAMPPGVMAPWAGNTGNVPDGWLLCNGALVSKTTYANLYAAIGDEYGAGNATQFKLPDFRSNTIGGYDSRYPAFNNLGAINGAMAHALVGTGDQTLIQWLVVNMIIKT